MNAYEWIFEEERILATYKYSENTFYTVEPDGQIIFLHIRDWILKNHQSNSDEINNWIAMCLGIEAGSEEYDALFWCEDCPFIEYTKLDFLKSINIEGDITCFGEPCQRRQLVCIRGTCSHQCPDCIPKYQGYALWDLPACDREKHLVGTSVWTSKWATIFDMLIDTFYWISRCKCLDVLIYNFDFTPICDEKELAHDFCSFAAHIHGNTIRFIESTSERKKLFDKYSKEYECVDYDIEDSIRVENPIFTFDKPAVRKRS